MTGTLASLIIALGLIFYPGIETKQNIEFFGIIAFLVGTLFLLFQNLSLALAFGPLQKAEQNITPRIIQRFNQDGLIKFTHFWLALFPLLSYLAAVDSFFLNLVKKNILLAIWAVLLGISIDCLHLYYKRILNYLNPFAAIKMFSQTAMKDIQNDREIELCDCLDALSEIAIKAIDRTNISLCTLSINESQNLIRHFLESSKSIGHASQDKDTKTLGITDKVSYTLFYLFQRLDMINDKALEKKFETICTNLITILGKIAVDAAKYDLSMASYPLFYLNKFAKKAIEHKLPEVGTKATLVLIEVSKVIVKDVDIKYSDLKDPFLAIINHLEEIAKETFRQNKSISIGLLSQPFKELKEIFNDPKVSNHQDQPVIIQDIDRVINEFAALEAVMSAMPPIPKISEEEEEKPIQIPPGAEPKDLNP